MTVTTARRSEIVRSLQKLRSEPALSGHHDALTDAILLIEGKGIPFDELASLPSARSTDPDTSHEFKLTIGEAHRSYLRAFLHGDHTPDEAAQFWLQEPGPGPRKRISELKRGGLLADTGKRRPSALGRPQQVLAITEHGHNEAVKLGLVAA